MMMMILVPFIAFSMVAAIYYTVTHHDKKTNQLGIKNKLSNVMRKDRYEQIKTPTSISARNHRNTKPRTHLKLNHDSTTIMPSNTFIAIDETKTTTHSEQKKQMSQKTGKNLDQMVTDDIYSTVVFNNAELELIRAGYIHRSTGKRKISRKNKNNYITTRNGKIFDAQKIINVMQKKLTNGNCKERYEDNMALKLQSLQAGINALMTQDELPKSFEIPDNCIVHRIVKNVTYGELKQIANTKMSSIELDGSQNTENVNVNTTQRPRIKALKINYKVKIPRH
jgi:hypothetical protein